MFNLIHGDCLNEMRKMPEKSIDCIITSPPYNIGQMHSNRIRYGSYQGNDMHEKEYQEWQIDFLNECYRILKDDGYMFYNHKPRIKNGGCIHPMEWILKSKFCLKQEIVWDMGKSANCDKIRFFPFSERVYWLAKNKNTKIYNSLNLSDVWRCVPKNNRKKNKHIAVMPEYIVECILKSIPKDDFIVLDPFMGIGTTGVVCLKLFKSFIGIEIDESSYNISKERLQEIENERKN